MQMNSGLVSTLLFYLVFLSAVLSRQPSKEASCHQALELCVEFFQIMLTSCRVSRYFIFPSSRQFGFYSIFKNGDLIVASGCCTPCASNCLLVASNIKVHAVNVYCSVFSLITKLNVPNLPQNAFRMPSNSTKHIQVCPQQFLTWGLSKR